MNMGEEIDVLRGVIFAVLLVALLLMITYVVLIKGVVIHV